MPTLALLQYPEKDTDTLNSLPNSLQCYCLKFGFSAEFNIIKVASEPKL